MGLEKVSLLGVVILDSCLQFKSSKYENLTWSIYVKSLFNTLMFYCLLKNILKKGMPQNVEFPLTFQQDTTNIKQFYNGNQIKYY